MNQKEAEPEKKPPVPGSEENKKIQQDTTVHKHFQSCAIEELKKKSMDKPEKHKATSVFIASKEQIERAKELEQKIRESLKKQDPDGKARSAQIKSILTATNIKRDPNREKKLVQFKLSIKMKKKVEEQEARDELALEPQTSVSAK